MKKPYGLKPKTFLTTIMVVVSLFTVSVFMYKSIIDKIIDNRSLTINSFKEEQFDVLWYSLEKLQLEAEKKVTLISENIESDILSLTEGELSKLQEDMTNDTLNHTLHEILESNIKNESFNDINNHMNGIVIFTTDGFMEDFNYHRASTDEHTNIREWQTALNNSYNRELEVDAIDKLLNRNSGIIALESYNLTKNDNHIKIRELTYDTLLEVYLEEGIYGLRNYQILVPYYITDFGDIFGVPDIMHGSKVDNNKLIVAQEFNLYDQITNEHSDLLFNNDHVNGVIARYDDLLKLLYILGISLITGVIGLVLYLCAVYNSIVHGDDEDDEYEYEEFECEEEIEEEVEVVEEE